MSVIKKAVFLFLFLLFSGVGWKYVFKWEPHWKKGEDFRLAVLGDESLDLISISESRKMINILNVKGDVKLWVSRGYSWYRTDKLKKLLKEENQKFLAKEVLFYNFAFVPDKTLWLKEPGNWNSFYFWVKNLGIINTWYFKSIRPNLLIKEEIIDKTSFNSEEMDKWLSRDLSDNSLLESDAKIEVINKTGEKGLANFLAKRLGWSGFLVSRVGTESEDKDCWLVYSEKEDDMDSYPLMYLKNVFSVCKLKKSERLVKGEFVLEVGKVLTKLIKYKSYKID